MSQAPGRNSRGPVRQTVVIHDPTYTPEQPLTADRKTARNLTPEDREKYIRKHVQGAVVRSGGGLIMVSFSLCLYMSGSVDYTSSAGAVTSGLFIILMNFPALFIIERIRSRVLFDITSFLINLVEILGYTGVIYFLGGIRASYLVPIYAAMLPERHRLPKVRACIDHWARWMRGEATATPQG